jgi:hypothetical protein
MAEAHYTHPLKTCTSCGIAKLATAEFFGINSGGKYGLRGQCRVCWRARVRELIQRPEIRLKRQENARAYVESGRAATRRREWEKNNPEKVAAQKRRLRAKHKDRIREEERSRRAANRAAYRAKQRRADAKLQKCPEHVLKKRIKARLRQMLKGRVIGRTEALLGFTRVELKRHIERQFTAGMTWERLMRGEIHIDHIIPVSSFNITAVGCSEFRACWALSNLRPLWAEENQKKQAKILTLL